MSFVLSAYHLEKRFGSLKAVDDVSLEISRGERVALLGPNGAGKTTTLLMLLGAILPDSGSIQICGHEMPAQRAEAAEHLGFSAGYLPLPDVPRVREILEIWASMYGLADPVEAVGSALSRFGIEHLHDRRGDQLSSGQRTVVGLAKATLHKPELLVLDEPTASLDPDVSERVRAILEEVAFNSNSALLITSHNMVEVERLADRVVFIANGKIVADGTPAELVASKGKSNLEEFFLHMAASSRGSDGLGVF